jgi:carboxyl-terminal processing protease
MKFLRSFLITLAVVLCLSLGFIAGYLAHDRLAASPSGFSVLQQAYEILTTKGLKDPPSPPALEYGMIRGMLQAYDDPFTSFVEPAEHELETNTLEGHFGGIGVRLDKDQAGNIILYPFQNGPAARAGIAEGDRLLQVDALPITSQLTADAVEAALRGPVGQTVRLMVGHAPRFAPVELKVKREDFPLPSVSWHRDQSEPRLGIVEINIIAATTPAEVIQAVDDLQGRGVLAIALDLRDNYGGLLTAGVDTARLFLTDGTIIQQKYRGQETETYKVERPGQFNTLPLVILVNQNTASAAEIIAGALKVHQRARLIGTRTYGKDTIQLVYDLKGGASLHITAAKWWIPGLEPPLEGNGVQPDVPLENTDPAANPDPFTQAAVQALFPQRSNP